MRGKPVPTQLAVAGLVAASFLIALGTLWAFERGAYDFSVFHQAWRVVLEGRGADLYHATPDRYLYAPGFAWLLAPLGWLPRGLALALWCFAKAAVVGWIIRELNLRLSASAIAGTAAFGLLIVARPLLVDLQYGQVNTFVLGACAWALLGHFDARGGGPRWDFIRWATLAAVAVAKLFALPLLIVPFLVPAYLASKRLAAARTGALFGFALVLIVPLFFVGPHAWIELMKNWHLALVSRGLPLESHNQSFAAFLYHYMSGLPIHVIAEGGEARVLGPAWLSGETIRLLTLAWATIWMGFLLGWLVAWRSKPPLRFIAISIGLLMVPSHLLWKPYFVLSLPAAILVADRAIKRLDWTAYAAFAIFAAINFTGFDFVGAQWGGRFEAASIFLLAHLALLGLCARA